MKPPSPFFYLLKKVINEKNDKFLKTSIEMCFFLNFSNFE